MNTKYSEWKTNTQCEISNRNNPYDEAGVKHNDLVAEIESKGSSDMSLDAVFKLADEVSREHFGKDLVDGYSSKKFANPIINFESDEQYREYINNLKISRDQKENIFALNDIMFNYDGNNLCEIVNRIKKFEGELIAKYKPEEMINVLTSSSIGRYALAYWDNRLEDNNQELRKGFWKKLFTGVADAIGGAAGAVAGSATVVGGIGGAVVGAIGASTGFAKVWDIFAK